MVFSVCASANNGALTVFSAPVPVFSEQDSNGKPAGYSIDLVKAVLDEADLSFTITQTPFSDAYENVRQHSGALITGLVRTPEREQHFHWLTPITSNPSSIFALDSHWATERVVPSLDNFERIGVLEGDYREQYLLKNHKHSVAVYGTWEKVVEALLAGQVDGILFSNAGLKLICKRIGKSCDNVKAVIDTEVFYSYLAMSKGHDTNKLSVDISNAALRYKASPRFEALASTWLPKLSKENPKVYVADGIVGFGSREELVNTGDIWVITSPEPVFSELDTSGKPHGYAVELVDTILANAGIKKRVLSAPWERIFKETEAKSNVMAFSVVRTPEREDTLHWITPITSNKHGLFGRRSLGVFNSLRGIDKQLKIAVIKYDYRVDVAKNAGLNFVEFPSWVSAVKALVEGDVDMLFGSAGAVSYGCTTLDVDCEDFGLNFEYKQTTTYLVLSKIGTKTPLVERLKIAAFTTKQSEMFQHNAMKWLKIFENRSVGPVHFDNGVVKLWHKQ